jgi:uncharacterized protein (DUF1800 family)
MKKIFSILASTFLVAAPVLAAESTGSAVSTAESAAKAINTDDQIIHLLNRISFGPRPGDIARVKQMGIQEYIDSQLNPSSIPDPLESSGRPEIQAMHADPVQSMQRFRELQKLNQQFQKAQTASAQDGATQGEMMDDVKAQYKAFNQKTQGAYMQARLERAIESPRQLQEVMTDFWYNHFNVCVDKGMDKVLVGPYEETAIRPYVLGKFKDMVMATCVHPGMLFYLDNWQNTSPNAPGAHGKGLNENYARELMELHTLGVDGGYTQKDVIELARILTGLTIAGPNSNRNPHLEKIGEFGAVFDPARHDFTDKTLLGQRIEGKGFAEIEQAVDMLCRHPSTAHHIAFQIAQYFVADNPPPALVAKLAKRFSETDGNIKAVMEALLSSPEFWSPTYQQNKFKAPFRYVVSALRATGAEPDRYDLLVGFLRQQGEPMYGCLTPDGYKNTKDAWMNPDALMRRLNFATALGTGHLQGVVAEAPEYRTLGATISNGKFSPQTVATVAKQPEELRSALLIGSPEFMRY